MIQQLEHPTWHVHDATKLKAYMTCPRKYFFEYVLGWRLDYPQHDLVFGEAWHRAMAHILEHGYGSFESAINDAFLPYYRTSFGPETDIERAPKNPGYALDTMIEYVKKYSKEDTFKVNHIEVYGTVNVTDQDKLHFRLDSVCIDDRGVFCLEHKTTKMDTATWDAEWAMSMQTSLYNHVLLCMYGFQQTYGIVVNGSVFRKSGPAFKRVHVRPSVDMMQAWLQDTRGLITQLKINFDAMLAPGATDEKVMPCFRRNTEACTKYNRVCPYHAFCTVWPNPLQRCDEVPFGFILDRWNPADQAKESGKEVVEVR